MSSPRLDPGASDGVQQQLRELDDYQARVRGLMEPLTEALLLHRPEDAATFIVRQLGGDAGALAGATKLDESLRRVVALRDDVEKAGAARQMQAVQRGRAARKGVAERRQQTAAATQVQAMQRGKAARKEVAGRRVEKQAAVAAVEPAAQRQRAITEPVAASVVADAGGEESGLDKFRRVVAGRTRRVATMFIKAVAPADQESDGSDDERYAAGTAWLRKRDQQNAMEIAHRLHAEEMAAVAEAQA
jgi:hypothetical protein